jgi:uncharacterized caspase-like protein
MAKIGLLIGVSEYEQGLNRLPAASKDVEAMKLMLLAPDKCGFDQVKTLINPDSLTMQIEIQNLFSSSRQKNDLILLFFSGHGIKDDRGKLYLATTITGKNDQGDLIKATAVPAHFVHDIMNDCRSKRQVIILDCCFSGAFAEGLLAKDDGKVDIKNQLGGEGRVVLTSSTSTQYSFEQTNSDLSIYTQYFIEGIETGKADFDGDGMLSLDNLHEYAKQKVQEAVPTMKPEIYAIKEGYKIILAQTSVHNSQQQYRQQVQSLTSQGHLSPVGRMVLDELKQQLQLSSDEADLIEQEILESQREYQQKLQRYQQAFNQVINLNSSLPNFDYGELKQLQKILGIREDDAKAIETQLKPNQLKSSTEQLQLETVAKNIDSCPSSAENSSNNYTLKAKFLQRCQAEFALYVGPMAQFIIEETINQFPNLKEEELIKQLAKQIPNSQEAENFINKLL